MSARMIVVAAVLFLGITGAYAQAVPTPVQLQLGIGGGLTAPSGTLSDVVDPGWHAGAKLRLQGWIPLHIVVLGQYTRLPQKSPSTESNVVWMYGAGLEFPFETPIVTPYLAVDGTANSLTSTATGASSTTRLGMGVGAGAQISVPMVGAVDVSVKYQMLNLSGKDPGEESVAQISANVSFMFNLL